MKWRLRFLWMKTRPLATFCTLVAVPFLPLVPWVMAAGPDPTPLPAELLSFTIPIPTGAANGAVRGPSPPLMPSAVRRVNRGWEVRAIDGSEWHLLMTDRFAVRGDIRIDDLRAIGAFAERFLDAVHERMKGDVTDLRFSIRAFANDPEFRQWASCREVDAVDWFYDRRGAEIALLFGPGTDVSEFCGRLMRGVTLEYLDRVIDFRGPQHVADGVAAWFADYKVAKGRVAPRLQRSDPLELFKIADPGRLESAWKAWSEAAP